MKKHYVCPVCGNDDHDANALYCWVCGQGFPFSEWPKIKPVRGLDHLQTPQPGNVQEVNMSDPKANAIGVKVHCMAGNPREADGPEAIILTDCNIVVDAATGNVTFNVPARNFALAIRLDEMVGVMAEGVMLFHQLHDEGGGPDGKEG